MNITTSALVIHLIGQVKTADGITILSFDDTFDLTPRVPVNGYCNAGPIELPNRLGSLDLPNFYQR